ncbi:MAG: NAD-binding protein [Phycisphaerales bacterium]
MSERDGGESVGGAGGRGASSAAVDGDARGGRGAGDVGVEAGGDAVGSGRGVVIVAGFGIIGRSAAEAARAAGHEVVIVETNAATVLTQRGLGVRVVEGDVAEPAVLERAGIGAASMLVLAIPDEDAVVRCCGVARALRADLPIIVRARYMSLCLRARSAGATEAIVEEMVTAREMGRVVGEGLARAVGGSKGGAPE